MDHSSTMQVLESAGKLIDYELLVSLVENSIFDGLEDIALQILE